MQLLEAGIVSSSASTQQRFLAFLPHHVDLMDVALAKLLMYS